MPPANKHHHYTFPLRITLHSRMCPLSEDWSAKREAYFRYVEHFPKVRESRWNTKTLDGGHWISHYTGVLHSRNTVVFYALLRLKLALMVRIRNPGARAIHINVPKQVLEEDLKTTHTMLCQRYRLKLDAMYPTLQHQNTAQSQKYLRIRTFLYRDTESIGIDDLFRTITACVGVQLMSLAN